MGIFSVQSEKALRIKKQESVCLEESERGGNSEHKDGVDHAGCRRGAVRLLSPKSGSTDLWKTMKSSGFYCEYNGKLLKGFVLATIMAQFVQRNDSLGAERARMLTPLWRRQTGRKAEPALGAPSEGRLEDVWVR